MHARDPCKRVDTLPCSRRVQVLVAGGQVADSARPLLLFETSLLVRYYVPFSEVRSDLLQASDHREHLPVQRAGATGPCGWVRRSCRPGLELSRAHRGEPEDSLPGLLLQTSGCTWSSTGARCRARSRRGSKRGPEAFTSPVQQP